MARRGPHVAPGHGRAGLAGPAGVLGLAGLLGLSVLAWPALSRASPPDGGRPGGRAGAPGPRNDAVKIRRLARSPRTKGGPAVELELTSSRPFPAMGSPPVLHIGSREFVISRYRPDGDLHTLIFTLTPEELDATREGDPVVVRYPSPELVWSFGPLRKPR